MAGRDEEMERLRAELASLTESRTFWRKFAAKLEAERDELKAEILDLRASVEDFLRGNADRLRSGDTTADLADLAYNYWHLTGWTALTAPEATKDAKETP